MESEVASSFNYIHSVLKELEIQCRVRRPPEWVPQWFNAKNDYDEFSKSVCGSIKQLATDWMFLIMFYESVDKWKKADNQEEQESCIQTIASVASGIATDLSVVARQRNEYTLPSRKALKLLEVLIRGCQTKTEHLMREIGATANCWSGGCSYLVRSRTEDCLAKQYFSMMNRYSPLKVLQESVLVSLRVIMKGIVQQCVNDAAEGNLNKQIYAFYNELKCIQEYFGALCKDYTFSNRCSNKVEEFLICIASVAVSTANHSCNYWFNKKIEPDVARHNLIAGLVDVQHQISPTNPNFVRLTLEVLITFNQICRNQSLSPISKPYFLVNWVKEGDLEKELKSLVDLVITVDTKGTCHESEQSFIGETRALLVEAASCRGKVCNEAQTDCSVLLMKICLLKVELFLKEKHDDEFTFESMDRKVKKLDEVLEKLRKFSKDLPQEKIEYGMQTLVLMEEVASLYQSCLARTKKITVFKVKDSLFQLLNKIVFFKAESFLEELLKSNNSNLVARGEGHIEALLVQLKFFKEFLTNHLMNNTDEVDEMFQQVEVVARRITSFSYSFLPNEVSDQRIEEMITSFGELFDELKHIKGKLREICTQFPMPNIPKTCELLFIDFLIGNIRELPKYDPQSIRSVKNLMTEIQQHLESLKSFLKKVSELDIEHSKLKDLGNDVMHVVHKLDYVIDIQFGVDWQHFFRFYNTLEELRFVSKQASGIQMITLNANFKNVLQVSCDRMSRDCTQEASNEVAVDLSDQEEVIIDRLTRGSSKRAIVSIVGMPGIGKTTLARQVYNSKHVMYHFHRRAWCTVSQVYEKRELLLEILSGIQGLTDEIRYMSNADLESKLRQCLLKNKYLIVMDDVWDIGVWNDLQISFPDDGNGSRIMITTRLCDVAFETNPNSESHQLRPFSDEESWKLLKMKIFKGECCPEELLLVGKEIAQQCKGLPLAVVAISGLLKRTEKRQDQWKRIAETLSSKIINDPEARCMEILELSYKHLPEYLKACFLYLGAFLEDKDILVTKLIRFWLAEGFILKTEPRSLELVAEDHLMDLINRSLVIISKRRSNGKVKTCQVHDLIRDFCRSKAKEVNFLKVITSSDEPYASFLSSDYGFEFEYDHHFDPTTYEAYRLIFSLRRNDFVDSRPSGLGTRSLIFLASTNSDSTCPYDISFICQNFKFLRVLDLEWINMGVTFPSEIGLLVQLRYLAVSGYVRDVPQSIANLWKLETLVVKGFRGKVMLPDTIWFMSSLRHLHVNKYVVFNLHDEKAGSSFQLENLVSFSSPALSYGEEAEKIFKRLPNLCKLRCVFLESWDSSKNCNQFPILNFLFHLQSLRILYFGKALNPGEFILPLNLKKLTLSHFHLPWSHISAIGRLPQLEVLKFDSGTFEGQRWDMREEEFQELKFLKLDTMNIAEWNASCDHLPKLERLVLQNCKDLQEIPCDFSGIATLELIEVHWCRQSAEKSAKEIAEATGEIKVLISHL